MITFSTAIPNPKDISRLVKLNLRDVREFDEADPPYLLLTVLVLGPGGALYGGERTLAAYNETASTCLRVKAVPQTYEDLLEVYGAVIPNLYTTLSTLWNGNVAGEPTKRKRLRAVEAALPSSGLLSAEFSGESDVEFAGKP